MVRSLHRLASPIQSMAINTVFGVEEDEQQKRSTKKTEEGDAAARQAHGSDAGDHRSEATEEQGKTRTTLPHDPLVWPRPSRRYVGSQVM